MKENTIQNKGEIVLYQPDESIRLEVRLDEETVWLSQAQICELFGKVKSTISYHINNVFAEGELDKNMVVRKIRTTTQHGAIKGKTQEDELTLYNLDVIISVGYRVHNQRGTQFRIWATKILKNYLINGCVLNPTIQQVEYHLSRQIAEHSDKLYQLQQQLEKHEKQLDFFITTSTPPAEMVFFEGDFYKAQVALENIVKTAKTRVIIVDGYVNSLTLNILDVREKGVEGIIYTNGVGVGMQNLMTEHDRLFPDAHIDIRKWRKESHDRWLIIDDRLYHCGHSLNANGGHKISAITLMGASPEAILGEIGEA